LGAPRAGGGAARRAPPRSGGSSNIVRAPAPDPQVLAKPRRRRFGAEFKLEVLREADHCKGAGEVGALLRRHGLYSSHLTTWRREREEAAHERLSRKRGRKPAERNPLSASLAQREAEIRRLQAQLRQAELIIDIQKKASALLGIPLNHPDNDGND